MISPSTLTCQVARCWAVWPGDLSTDRGVAKIDTGEGEKARLVA